MPTFDYDVTTAVTRSTRARQLEGSFDVPPSDNQRLRWHVSMPIEDKPWQVGLIVGPSGCGKSTLLRRAFGEPNTLTWGETGVIDDFPATSAIAHITATCSAVGFNTIPAWLRPYSVLSVGERFRVELARHLIESSPDSPIVLDEFTSVVDRQVAKIGSHAVQKYVRNNSRQIVVATCHHDVEDWLRPDWVVEPVPSHLDGAVAPSTFRWESVQPRPAIDIEITPATYEAWHLFAPFHYLTASLNRSARCYVLWASIDGAEMQPAAFAGLLHRPTRVRTAHPVWGVSRLVTLPDWQGLGLAFVLADSLGSAYRAVGCKLHTYPAHMALIRGFDRSPSWEMIAKPQIKSTQGGPRSAMVHKWRSGGRPNAVFRYIGKQMEDERQAHALFACA